MASKKAKSYSNPNFKGFVNVPLDDHLKGVIKAQVFEPDDFASWLAKLVDDGYKLTFSTDSYNNASQCAITHPDESHQNFGYFLVGRGSSPLKAFKQALYFHSTILEGNWSLFAKPLGKEEIDD